MSGCDHFSLLYSFLFIFKYGYATFNLVIKETTYLQKFMKAWPSELLNIWDKQLCEPVNTLVGTITVENHNM